MQRVRDRWRRVLRRRDEQGAAALEFGLIMPILLLLVFGIIQYGLYFWAMQGGSDIARDAARQAAVGMPLACTGTAADPGFTDVVTDQIDQLSGTSAASVERTYSSVATPDPTPGEVQVGDQVEVTVTFHSIDLHLPFVPHIRDGVVSASAFARVENVTDGANLQNCPDIP